MRASSYSSLNLFDNCPRQYDLTYNKGVIARQETEATLYGARVHEALERYARDGVELPDDCKKFQPYADKIVSLPGEKFFEREMAITRNIEPCGFADETAWLRGVLDVSVVNGNRAAVYDYKTGKIRPDSDQLMLFALFIFVHHPDVESVKTGYLWLLHGKFTIARYERKDIAGILEHFLTKMRRLEIAYEKDKWVPRPSGLCNGWCGAGKENCEFWKPRR